MRANSYTQLALPLLAVACAFGQADDIWSQAIRKGPGGPVGAQGQRQMPAGFKVVAQNGSGQALVGISNGATPARQAFSGALRHVSGYFDGRPQLQAALADANNQQVQGFFRASIGGTPVQGLMIVATTADSVQVAVMFDRPEVFSRSVAGLTRQAAAMFPRTAGAAGGGGRGGSLPRMVRTAIPDGSGYIDLPAGYIMTGFHKGALDIQGPQGQLIALGGAQSVYMQGYPGSKMMFGPYRAPWPAFQLWMDSTYGGVLRSGQAQIRMLEQTTASAQNGQSAMFTYELSGMGKTARGLASVSTTRVVTDISNWVYYSSVVAAPAERYAQDLPTMWAIWQSWSINPAVFRERMEAALQSMRETYNIIKSVGDNQRRAGENYAIAWDQTVRGVTAVQNIGTGGRTEINTNYAQHLVDELNRQGYQYRVVPNNELAQ